MAYGSQSPLRVEGSFETETDVNGRKVCTTFYGIRGGTRDLLGKTSLLMSGVLQAGIEFNKVENSIPQFLKLRVILLVIDNSTRPIPPPCRREIIHLEKKVKGKIKELLNKDIIEAT